MSTDTTGRAGTAAAAGATSAIPSAGIDFPRLLSDAIVIEGDTAGQRTGAQSIEPEHSPRAMPRASEVPTPGLVPAAGGEVDLQREVEQFLYRQAELLDGKHWQAWIDCFAEDGVYWMPVSPEQTDWEGHPSIFIEDRAMMEIRMGRVLHPNAWSQAPLWETNHVVGNVAIEAAGGGELRVRSRFHAMELRRDTIRHFGGTYRHLLVRDPSGALRIRMQRVDLFNAQAPFDYVLQVWL